MTQKTTPHKYRRTFDLLRKTMTNPDATQEQKDAALDAAEEIVDNLLAQIPDEQDRIVMLRRPRIPRK